MSKLSPLVLVSLLIGVLGSLPARAAPPPCKPGDHPTWCDPKMVAMKLQDAQGTIDIRLENGAPILWQRPAWKGKLNVQAERGSKGLTQVTIWLPLGETEKRLLSVTLRKGEAATIIAGRHVPADYFGPSAAPVKFILDE
jgi:hypothetical protein